MSDYIIRPLSLADAPRAAALWSLVFGDDEAVVLEFFRIFAHTPHFGFCAELDGTIAAAAYCPQGTDLITPDGTVSNGAYLYAVATHPDHRKRGLAAKLCRRLKEDAFAAGCAMVFTKPSEDSLYPWYEEKIGAVPALGGKYLELTANHGAPLSMMSLTHEEYFHRRNAALRGTPHVRHSIEWTQWDSLLHQAYGGGFYAVGDCIIDLFFDGSTMQVNELLPTPQDAETVLQGIIAALGAERCVCTLHGDDQYVSVCPKDEMLPTNNPWFGPCYG